MILEVTEIFAQQADLSCIVGGRAYSRRRGLTSRMKRYRTTDMGHKGHKGAGKWARRTEGEDEGGGPVGLGDCRGGVAKLDLYR